MCRTRRFMDPLCLLMLASLVGLVAAPHANAVLCTLDEVPAATLFVPYFEVDVSEAACNDPTAGSNTLIRVTNADAHAQVINVMFWTDWSVGSLNFSVYLTGYDVQTIDLRDIFCNGNLPRTGPGSGLSPVGPVSAPHTLFPNCNNSSTQGTGPNYSNPFSPLLVDLMQTWHTGRPAAALGTCAGRDHGDLIARGYVTIDVTLDCSLSFPSEPGYFESEASMDNVLLGDVTYIGAGAETLAQVPAVHLEADPAFFADNPSLHTFYGRYTFYNGQGPGTDGREPLPVGMSAPFRTSGAIGETQWLTWREPGGSISAVACGTEPAGLPQLNPLFAVFDEQESVVAIEPAIPDVVTAFDAQAGTANPFEDGWALMDFRDDNVMSIYGDQRAQSWVTTLSRSSDGTFASGATHGTPIGTGADQCNNELPSLPDPRVFVDSFESGDTSAWSDVLP